MTCKEAALRLAPWLQHHPDCARHEAELCDCGLNEALVEVRQALPTIPFGQDAQIHVDAMRDAMLAFFNGSHGYHADTVNR